MTKKQLIKELQTLWSKTKNFFKRIFKRKHKVTDEELAEMIEIPIDTTYKPEIFEMLEEQHLTNDTSVTYDNNYDYEATKELPQAFQCGGVENAGKILKVDTDGYIRLSEGGSGEVTKEYVDNGLAKKVDKVTNPLILYGTNYKGAPYYFSVSNEPATTDGVPLYLNGILKTKTPVMGTDCVNLSYFNTHMVTIDRIGVGATDSTGVWEQKMTIYAPKKIAWVFFQINTNVDHSSKIVEVKDNGFSFNGDFYEFEEGTRRVVLQNWYQSNYMFRWTPATASLEVFCNKPVTEKRICGFGF